MGLFIFPLDTENLNMKKVSAYHRDFFISQAEYFLYEYLCLHYIYSG